MASWLQKPGCVDIRMAVPRPQRPFRSVGGASGDRAPGPDSMERAGVERTKSGSFDDRADGVGAGQRAGRISPEGNRPQARSGIARPGAGSLEPNRLGEIDGSPTAGIAESLRTDFHAA